MDIIIQPRLLRGKIQIIPSKSQAHRYLICAALGKRSYTIICPETNRDIESTVKCLNAMGASIVRTRDGYEVTPIVSPPKSAVLECGESGSTIRFLLPVAGALGIEATFIMEGRLPYRPMSPLWEEMERMGCHLTRPSETTILCTGKLVPGKYRIDGSVSSQFVSGLLFALPLIGCSSLAITGNIESADYIRMTQIAIEKFSNDTVDNDIFVEGDWSNGAFWIAANALGSDIAIAGLNSDSAQGDRRSAELISGLAYPMTISAKDIPDLIPILSVVAASNQGAIFTDIQRLRMKESDRVASTIAMLKALGGHAEATEDTLTVYPSHFQNGVVDACNDHRIAMSAAIAATIADGPVLILGAECTQKSYPRFWEEYKQLGGAYEQYLR